MNRLSRMILAMIVLTAAVSGVVSVLDDGSAVSGHHVYGEVVTYQIDYQDEVRDVDEQAAAALDYWERNGEHLDGGVTFVQVSAGEEPDMMIELVSEVESCDESHTHEISGCAPIIEERSQLPAHVQVDATQPAQAVRETAKHEVGHALGLTHDDEPQRIMAAELPAIEDREMLLVGLTDSASGDRIEIEQGLSYLADQEETTVDEIRLVEDTRDADLILESVPGSVLDDQYVTEFQYRYSGHMLLQYDGELDREVLGWYIASSTAELYYEELPAELSPVRDYDERRGDWDS